MVFSFFLCRWFIVDGSYHVTYYKAKPKRNRARAKPLGSFSCMGYTILGSGGGGGEGEGEGGKGGCAKSKEELAITLGPAVPDDLGTHSDVFYAFARRALFFHVRIYLVRQARLPVHMRLRT